MVNQNGQRIMIQGQTPLPGGFSLNVESEMRGSEPMPGVTPMAGGSISKDLDDFGLYDSHI